MSHAGTTREQRERPTMHALLEAHALGDSMGIWGWVHATRALEPFVPAGGPVRDLWAVMARHDADTNRNDWLGLADDILSADAAALAQAREDLRACAEALAGCVSEARIARSADEYPESGTPYNIANDCAERISGYAATALARPGVQAARAQEGGAEGRRKEAAK